MTPKILIVNLGSQYTEVIERTLRELGVRSAILPPTKAGMWIKTHEPRAIILSGGMASVNDNDAPSPPREVLTCGAPVLGICYGMQWLAKQYGGAVEAIPELKDYGATTEIRPNPRDPLFNSLAPRETVLASHGDSVTRLPEGFQAIASSSDGGISAMSSKSLRLWGVQFHPEVKDTPKGKTILGNFLFGICRLVKDWEPGEIISTIRGEIASTVGKSRAIIGASGGVDSTALLALAKPLLGENLLAITIDGGQLRQDELGEIQNNAAAAAVALKIIATHEFLHALKGETDAERKRLLFRSVYERLFTEEATACGASFVLQGSLAPDFIESGEAGGDLIKSHHNIGLSFGRTAIHPFRHLFKYEVRELARILGLPDCVTKRHPFPGPGLFVRMIGGEITTAKLEALRWADNAVRWILTKHGEHEKISQLVVARFCTKVVGVKGDARTYADFIGVRAVRTADYMTAKGHQLPARVREEITATVTKHPEFVHVAYFEADKPPATVEFE